MQESKPRILHMTTVPATLGFVSGQPRFMSAHGFDVHALSSPGEPLERFGDNEGVQVYAVPMARRITPFRDLIALWRIYRTVRQIRPDIVHAHTPKAGLLGMLASTMSRVSVRIYHIHGLPVMTARGIKRVILRWTEKVSCRCAHRVLCVSRSVGNIAVGQGLCPPDKLRVIGNGSANGVDAAGSYNPECFTDEDRALLRARFRLPKHAQVLGFVGRLVRNKGLVELSVAWESLKLQFPALHLLIVGRAESEDPIPQSVMDVLRRDHRVHLVGAVEKEAMPGVYSVIDVLAFPTWREGFGNVAIEAAAMEVPVVASNVPGIVDAVQDGVTGTLVPPCSGVELARAIKAYLLNPNLCRIRGQAGRIRVLRCFQPTDIWPELRDEYAALLERHRSGQGRRSSRGIYPAVKRAFDVMVAAMLLVGLSPIILAAGIAIRLTMGRPVIFRDERPGKDERLFTILKFRTMSDERGAEGDLLPDRHRLTRLGRLLRRTSIDELPQLWNVLKGDMSLIGPRPLRTDYIPHYTRRERRRHEVRPGITGLAQVGGRNALPWDERLELDVSYVEHHGLLLDLRLAALTVLRVIARSGIEESPGEALAPLSVCRSVSGQPRIAAGGER